MKNQDDIIIPRSELPEVLTTINMTGTFVHPSASANMWTISKESSATVRRRAMDYLAVAERIDGHLAAAQAEAEERAKAAEEQKLDEEGLILHNALHDSRAEAWEAGSYAKRYWRNVARAARELHGK